MRVWCWCVYRILHSNMESVFSSEQPTLWLNSSRHAAGAAPFCQETGQVNVVVKPSLCTAHSWLALAPLPLSIHSSLPPLLFLPFNPLPVESSGRKEERLLRGACAARITSQELMCHRVACCSLFTDIVSASEEGHLSAFRVTPLFCHKCQKTHSPRCDNRWML